MASHSGSSAAEREELKRYREDLDVSNTDSESEEESEEAQDPIGAIRVNTFEVADPFSLDPLAIEIEGAVATEPAEEEHVELRANVDDW